MGQEIIPYILFFPLFDFDNKILRFMKIKISNNTIQAIDFKTIADTI